MGRDLKEVTWGEGDREGLVYYLGTIDHITEVLSVRSSVVRTFGEGTGGKER